MKVDMIYQWIRSLVFYMILMTMIMNMLPDKKYEKYLQLFTGAVFVLLVVSPFTDLTGVENRVAGAFERLTFQTDVKLLVREIEDADGERMNRLVESFETAVETDIRTMAESADLECLDVDVMLETDVDAGTFGAVQAVRVSVGDVGDKGAESVETAVDGEGASNTAVVPESEKMDRVRERRAAINRAVADLRSKIGEYYGIEERNIAITLKTE